MKLVAADVRRLNSKAVTWQNLATIFGTGNLDDVDTTLAICLLLDDRNCVGELKNRSLSWTLNSAGDNKGRLLPFQ